MTQPRISFVTVPVTLEREYRVNSSETYVRLVERTITVGYQTQSTDKGTVLELSLAAQSVADKQYNGRKGRGLVHGRWNEGRTATITINAADVDVYGGVQYSGFKWLSLLKTAELLPPSWDKWEVQSDDISDEELVGLFQGAMDAALQEMTTESSDGYLEA